MRYYFDLICGQNETVDDEGCDLSEAEMQKQAVRLLAEIASDEAPTGNPPALTARVRDAQGNAIYRAVLHIEGARLQ